MATLKKTFFLFYSKLAKPRKAIFKIDRYKSFDFEKHYKAGAVVFDAKAVVDRRWVDGKL